MLFKYFYVFFILVFSLSTQAAAKKNIGNSVQKSSEIPERREFPINQEINPCNDFYQYTCSKVIDSFKLRDDRSAHTFSFNDSFERILKKKKEYLHSLSQKKNKTEGEQELSDVYTACMNTDARKKKERELVKNVVDMVDGISTKEEFLQFLSEQITTGNYSFLSFGGPSNQKDSRYLDVYLISDVRSLPERSYYQDPKVLKDFKKMAQSFYEKIGRKNAAQAASNLLHFEKQIDKSYPTPKKWRQTYWGNKTLVPHKKAQKDFPAFKLENFFKKIPAKTKMRAMDYANLRALNEALVEEDLEMLKNIYLFHRLSPKMDEGYPEYYKTKFDFNKNHLGGAKKRSPLKERCTSYVMNDFSKELDYELFPIIFKGFSKKKFLKLSDKVRGAIIDSLKENEWLDRSSKKAAIKKMKRAFMQVVKPDTLEEWNFGYKADYSKDDYLANKKLRREKGTEKFLDELSKKQNSKKWSMSPLTVNAYYSPSHNKFVMLAGILQYPFYDQSQPDHVNLGAVGMVIGHELGHGVDNAGSKYDYKGRLKNWMSQKDLKEFEKRTVGLVKQFDKIGHNGGLTLGENIGDLVGLTAAYRAAFPKPGKTKLKAQQEFFVQYGRSWCQVMRPGAIKSRLKTDPHSLGYARVNEQVKHQPGFQKAFSCKKGDKLYLSEKDQIKIW